MSKYLLFKPEQDVEHVQCVDAPSMPANTYLYRYGGVYTSFWITKDFKGSVPVWFQVQLDHVPSEYRAIALLLT